MPYLEPQKREKGWVLPKAMGGYHRSMRGKMIYFKSKQDAMAAGRAIMMGEHKK